MLPKHAEELNAKRIGINRAFDISPLDERLKQSPEYLRELKKVAEIATVRRETTMAFDREANEKDLVGRNRRGVEASVEYDLRRRAGIPPKNERDDPRSPYSRENIEDGLMQRESDNGVEYAAFWDKDGELVSIYKGDKSSVGAHIEGDKLKGGSMTHSHPSEFDANGNPKRPFGYGFSAGDLAVHAARDLKETRAVAREGTYTFTTDGEVRIPQRFLDAMPPAIQQGYAQKTGEAKSQYALRVLALIQKEGSPFNPIDRAVREVSYESSAFNAGIAKPIEQVIGSRDFLVRQGVYQKQMFEEFGVKWEFKPAAGFEDVGRAISSGTAERQTNWRSAGGSMDFGKIQPRTTAKRPSIIGSDGKRSDEVLRTYRDADQPRTAPPPKTAPKVTTAKRVSSAPQAPKATKPKEAEPIKPAPPVARPVEPPTRDLVGDFFRNVERRQRGGVLGALRKVELPRDVFGD